MLNYERANEARAVILRRIHQRYNMLRVARERIELLQEAKQP
jgi:propanediol dehydratase small subunit